MLQLALKRKRERLFRKTRPEVLQNGTQVRDALRCVRKHNGIVAADRSTKRSSCFLKSQGTNGKKMQHPLARLNAAKRRGDFALQEGVPLCRRSSIRKNDEGMVWSELLEVGMHRDQALDALEIRSALRRNGKGERVPLARRLGDEAEMPQVVT